MIDIHTAILTIASIMALIGALGFFRFPDFYTRTHAATLMTVGGTCLALAGLAIGTAADPSIPKAYPVKIIVILIFILVTNPTAAHALADAAYKEGVKPQKLAKNDMEKSR